ncbi:MAG: hypothetical protein JWQ42_4822 [Edaphobacter sp.]|nr:hypothetical protein [Edaphobacter sp.]
MCHKRSFLPTRLDAVNSTKSLGFSRNRERPLSGTLQVERKLTKTIIRQMKLIVTALLLVGFNLLPTPGAAKCHSIPGAEQLWSDASVHWVLIGEMHGSNETPDAFSNLVCNALAHKRQVTMALERPTSEQAALDGILTHRNLTAAEKVLLAEPDWKNGMDGRASEAMMRLLLTLRQLREIHSGLEVVAFDAPSEGEIPGARDQAMGHTLLGLGRAKPHSLILVLTGNVHAMQAPQFGYDFAAMYLPARERLSLEVTDTGGGAWVTFDGACGPSKGGVETKGRTVPFGISLDPASLPMARLMAFFHSTPR